MDQSALHSRKITGRGLSFCRMQWYQQRIVREQWVLLLIILVMCLILALQTFCPDGTDERFMLVPLDVTTSWQAILAGEATFGDLSAFSTLVTNAMLHGDAGHLIFNLIFLWVFGSLVCLKGLTSTIYFFPFTFA